MPETVRSTGAAWEGDCIQGDGGATVRVERGGSWLNVPEYLRSAHRDPNPSNLRGNVRGFRLARGIAAH